MTDKVSTCLYIDKGVLQAAHEIGLNASKVAENGLVEAVRRLNGADSETGLGLRQKTWFEGPGPGFEPGR